MAEKTYIAEVSYVSGRHNVSSAEIHVKAESREAAENRVKFYGDKMHFTSLKIKHLKVSTK